MNRSNRRRGAFTLIELLVVVAIIALLLTILLPSLARAREQAKISVCLSNMHQTGLAAHTYLNDGFNAIPFALPFTYYVGDTQYSCSLITEFVYAGGIPDKRLSDWRATGLPDPAPMMGDIYKIPPRHRPMNRYYAPNVTWDREPADRLNHPADIPDWFKCPSDSSAAVPLAGSSQNDDIEFETPYQTWAFWGNSYASNWYWPYYYEGTTQYSGYPNGFGGLIGGYEPRIKGLGGTIMKHMLDGRWAAEWIMFYENRLNYALEGAGPRGYNNRDAKSFPGWHRQKDYHVALHGDGHASYKRYDTRYIDGPGWTIWPPRPWLDGTWKQYENK